MHVKNLPRQSTSLGTDNINKFLASCVSTGLQYCPGSSILVVFSDSVFLTETCGAAHTVGLTRTDVKDHRRWKSKVHCDLDLASGEPQCEAGHSPSPASWTVKEAVYRTLARVVDNRVGINSSYTVRQQRNWSRTSALGTLAHEPSLWPPRPNISFAIWLSM
ncbi:hypothetical protein HRR83_002546 [Exophiala dermatitidis]|uniref:Uncharacterized protein n=1 Tax=Exophiala dermatitidis TaxID=5970 RepID=A0AAN6EW86_EXODE|nr:hypothetical protein HRR73_005487 [Exophiala dermatitidis]KAJ4523774.1 hypothetical protein HRR74_001967 [Exophiala dermatitidis]KAJ4537287.1 hypothetical protein HRR76_005300 [Exophiala dermatitidis]KAJ4555115.1 hypothetical protein HRR77_001057 [Exophiala dermatitidis]KAJ4566296.1 hypothetical protein HRR79_005305 [Exophiala dermatitidis]